MVYDLGRYEFTTGADYTGFNPGNVTSILDTRSITVPYFECYRLVIDTSGLPSTLPQLVQSTSGYTTTSLTNLNLTFPAATTLGNTLVCGVGLNSTGTTPSVSGMTIGGVADHWGAVAAAAATSGTGQNSEMWIDPAASASGTTVGITLTGGTGLPVIVGFAYEFSGLLNTTSVSSAVDVADHGSSSGSTTTTTGSQVTTSGNDVMVGMGTQYNGTALANLNTGTTTPTLTDLTPIALSPAPGVYFSSLSSWGLTGVSGQTCKYQMVSDQSGDGAAGFLTLFEGTTGTAIGAFPFTVAIDGKTWDHQVTAAGSGFAYNALAQTMFLHEGQSLHIYWPLPVSQYGSYTDQFKITAWFRTIDRGR